MAEKLPPPNWSAFSAKQRVPIWQALALSLDLNPAILGADHFFVLNRAEQGLCSVNKADPDWLSQLSKRWQQLHKALNAESEPGLLLKKHKPELAATVRLDSFAAWAKSKRWKTPKALKQLASD